MFAPWSAVTVNDRIRLGNRNHTNGGAFLKEFLKIFLEIFLEITMPYGGRIFWCSNKKEPKALVNTGLSASFIIRYRLLKFLNFRQVDVPWKPFESNLTRVRIPFPPPQRYGSNDTNCYRTFNFLYWNSLDIKLKARLAGSFTNLPASLFSFMEFPCKRCRRKKWTHSAEPFNFS